MSATTAVIAPARRGTAPDPRRPARERHLEAVDSRAARRRKPTLFYAAVSVGAVFAIVATQLMLSIGVSQSAYQIASLQSSKVSLAQDLQAATERVDMLSSPQNLAAKASALGMVGGNSPAYLRLSTGTVIGAPAPARGTAAPGSRILVPNALLPTPETPAKKGAPSANDPAGQRAPVAWEGALPSPSTH
jgi:hypothetical protein